jgi:hypothetical protein
MPSCIVTRIFDLGQELTDDHVVFFDNVDSPLDSDTKSGQRYVALSYYKRHVSMAS